MTTSVELNVEKVNVNIEDSTAIIVVGPTLVDDLAAQFSLSEWVDAACDHFDFSAVMDYMIERKNEDEIE